MAGKPRTSILNRKREARRRLRCCRPAWLRGTKLQLYAQTLIRKLLFAVNKTATRVLVGALPLISPSELVTSEDQKLAARAFERKRQLAAASRNAEKSEIQPRPDVQIDAEILEYIKDILILIYHGVGTCAMGAAGEANAAADSRARVRDVTGLRVVSGEWRVY